MLRVKIRNFQSLESLDFTISGLTVITGPNNSGKSATLRAIRGLFQNSRNAKQFVRHGASQSDVILDLGDHTVRWEKSEKVNRYTVDGLVLDKVGAGVPPEVSALGVQPVRVGDLTLWPQIADQFTGQVFLIDQPGSVVAEAISDTERVAKLNGALRTSESDRRSVQQTLKIRLQDLAKAEDLVKKFDGLDAVLLQVSRLEKQQQVLSQLDEQVQTLVGLHSKLVVGKQQRDYLSAAVKVPLADPSVVATYRRDLLVLSGWVQKIRETRKVLTHLQGVEQVPSPQVPVVNSDIPWIQTILIRHQTSQRTVTSLCGVSTVPMPKPPEGFTDITDLWGRYVKIRNSVHRLRDAGSISIPDTVGQSNSRADYLVLCKWKDQVNQGQEMLREYLEHIENLQQQIDQASCEIQDSVEGACPVCGRTA